MSDSVHLDTWCRTRVLGANYADVLVIVPTDTECEILRSYLDNSQKIANNSNSSIQQYVSFIKVKKRKFL